MKRLPRLFAATALICGISACGGGSDPDAIEFVAEPRLQADMTTLDAALKCTPFTHPDKPAVLLVHGTFTTGFEQYDWTYIPLLSARGHDVCVVTYPDRGLGDLQVSAEYVVHALRRMHAQSGAKVAMIGHSQGALVPRWAIKWWPSAREAVQDFVLQAGPAHGTDVATTTRLLPAILQLLGLSRLPDGLFPEALYQFAPASNFIAAVNRGDETPGDIDYTSLYTLFDELVQPVIPVPTAALEFGRSNPHVSNILLQDVCPGRLVDHLSIGLTDRLAFDLTLDAISNPGPASFERAGGARLCGLLPIVPGQIIAPEAAFALIGVLFQEAQNGIPDPHLALREPVLKSYAQP